MYKLSNHCCFVGKKTGVLDEFSLFGRKSFLVGIALPQCITPKKNSKLTNRGTSQRSGSYHQVNNPTILLLLHGSDLRRCLTIEGLARRKKTSLDRTPRRLDISARISLLFGGWKGRNAFAPRLEMFHFFSGGHSMTQMKSRSFRFSWKKNKILEKHEKSLSLSDFHSKNK